MYSNKRRPTAGSAAVEKPGRVPLEVSAASAGCAYIPVHLAGFVRENPVAKQTLKQAIGFTFAVIALNTDQHQQAMADFRHARTVDVHTGTRNTLQQADHVNRPANSLVALTSASTVPASVAE
jgi:hypothetical protein